MDPNLYHTLPGGIEVKIVDILVIFINIAVILACIAAVIIFRAYKTIKDKTSKKTLQIGPLTHLADISGDKLYQWKQSNRAPQAKKKGFLKSIKGKQNLNSEEIACKTCGLIIKTTTVSFN